MLSRLFIAALWSPEGKGLTYWCRVYDVYCDFGYFPLGTLGLVWYLIVSIPDPNFELGPVVQEEMSHKDISYQEL